MSDNQNQKRELMPPLRFPEFREAGGWRETQLHKIAKSISQRATTGDGTTVLTLSGEDGLIPQNEYFGKQIAGDNVERYIKIARNDFVYNDRTTSLSTYGSIKKLSKCDSGIVSPIYKCFRFYSDENPFFWDRYFESGSHEAQLHGLVNEGARAGRFNISIDQFLSTSVWLPGRREQQKIADCLSSIDELITAEILKLDALKDHKRGLMQQLFPSDGETVPRLRFPEFQDVGEWEGIKLGVLGELVQGLTYSPDDVRERGLLVLRSSNIRNGEIVLDDCVYVNPQVRNANLAQPDDILICVRNGSTALIGKNALIPRKMPPCTHGAFMTIFRSRSPQFVFQLFQTPTYQKQVAADLGATINSINGSQFVKYKFFVPKPLEQQRIADCLSSVDQLIAAQFQRVDALKVHKKGLMQLLFPVVDEVQG
jgi:type I restriction enzyme S subunit